MLWGEDSLPYSIYHDTRGEAFAGKVLSLSVDVKCKCFAITDFVPQLAYGLI